MGTTLSNGFKKPAIRDSDWWTQLEDNIEQVNSHDHDGVDSNKITANNITKGTTTIAAADWSVDAGGSTFTKAVTMPSGYTFDNAVIMVMDTDTGDQLFPTITKTGASAYTISVNDNTLNLKVIYA